MMGIDVAILGFLAAQTTVLCGIFLKLGGMLESIQSLKNRVVKLEQKAEGAFKHA
tara:strand:+ start:599 stop:763 length:165 start_codon:yes stop_codon:yes gene_type:complete